MKTLYDGTEVSDDTPTKATSRGRFLLTEAEMLQREVDNQAFINKTPPEPSETEIRLQALEEKVGVTEEEKLAAKEKIKLKARTK